jgi:2-dehydro-3-deoxyphosphogluconate aldolase/(4S)-4-hydroxy-2-oxoglutarate aldolase
MNSLGAATGHRIVPALTIDDADTAEALARALAAGGISCAEVTLRTPAAFGAIAAMSRVPDFIVGVGTVLTPDQLDAAIEAGARFAVSPGFDDDVVDAALRRGIGVLPGVATATDLTRAVRRGIGVVKFFPADRLGGLATIRALAAPFVGMGFVPSGGVTTDLAVEYLADPAVVAVSGSWMAPRALIGAGDFDAIAQLSLAATRAIGSAA